MAAEASVMRQSTSVHCEVPKDTKSKLEIKMVGVFKKKRLCHYGGIHVDTTEAFT